MQLRGGQASLVQTALGPGSTPGRLAEGHKQYGGTLVRGLGQHFAVPFAGELAELRVHRIHLPVTCWLGRPPFGGSLVDETGRPGGTNRFARPDPGDHRRGQVGYPYQNRCLSGVSVVAVRAVASCAVRVHTWPFGHRALRLESDVMRQLARGRPRWLGIAAYVPRWRLPTSSRSFDDRVLEGCVVDPLLPGPGMAQMTQPEPGTAHEVDPLSPLFFLSYAHSQVINQDEERKFERNRRFVKFFNDLSENVAELVSRPAGSDPGYMDDRSITSGQRWTPELLRAIGTCQIFVALLSPNYFTSLWCGFEWHAFAQRPVTSYPEGEKSNQTAIVPVIWAPIRESAIPAIVKEPQWFYPHDSSNPNITARYASDGILGLLQIDNDAYQAVVWRLARRIAEIHYSHRVEPRLFQVDELRNVFEEQET